MSGIPISLYNHGVISRDYIHVLDVAQAIIKIILRDHESLNRFEPVNIGYGKSVAIKHVIKLLEKELAIKAVVNACGPQLGDVDHTLADNSKLRNYYNYTPTIDITVGIREFVRWYRSEFVHFTLS